MADRPYTPDELRRMADAHDRYSICTNPALDHFAPIAQQLADSLDRIHTVDDPGEALELLDTTLNAEGLDPDVTGTDRNGRPVLLWLREYGGDEVYLCAADLWAEDFAQLRVREVPPAELQWPLTLLLPSVAST